MKCKFMMTLAVTTGLLTSCTPSTEKESDKFEYNVERFADIEVIRYQVPGFDELPLQQKKLLYYLGEAAQWGRDILFDQNGRYNLRIRQVLEAIYSDYQGERNNKEFEALTVYLKRVWFSSGIHHHYGCGKFTPEFSPEFFLTALQSLDNQKLPLAEGESVEKLFEELRPVLFDSNYMAKRVNQADGEDLVLTSASNYYGEGVTQAEAEAFYGAMKDPNNKQPLMYGMNSRLVKEEGILKELTYKSGGLYGEALDKICYWLEKAAGVAENERQRAVIEKLIAYYKSGDLKTFDEYTILWVNDVDSRVDFVNGFTESYGDPLGIKASWESIVNFKDLEATARAEAMSQNAQWFEDNAPIDARFKKAECKGVSAKVITAAMLGGDLYPATAIGINLPNSNWVRAEHGSKSVTINNITDAYKKASQGSGFDKEFVINEEVLAMMEKYGALCSNLHTDLHECLGHGSGKLLPGVDSDALKAYGATIEETRADLFGLYYLADEKLVELGLTPDMEAYKAQFYSYMLNGLMTQLVRIEPGHIIEESHMRNRAIVARWALEKGAAENVVEMVAKEGKTYIQINDYAKLRDLFGQLLAEVQRIKSEGDLEAARLLVENYGVQIDRVQHAEILARFKELNISPYKGFINPVYQLELDEKGEISDITLTYSEGYDEQMLRYSKDYSALTAK